MGANPKRIVGGGGGGDSDTFFSDSKFVAQFFRHRVGVSILHDKPF